MTLLTLSRQIVAKPWGRDDVPACFDTGPGRIGEVWFDAPGQALPLLVKWLFTSENLSIQVHPDDRQARATGLSGGKEECWFITHAAPGARLGIGTQDHLSADALRAAALSGEIEQKMDWIAVQPGDWFHIPPGTIHAIGAGVTLVEIQQNHDVTYRLYDYGRPRELHLDAGVQVSRAGPHPGQYRGRLDPNSDAAQVMRCDHFAIYHGRKNGFQAIPAKNMWLVPLSGTITTRDGTAGVGDVLYGTPDSATGASADFTFLAAST